MTPFVNPLSDESSLAAAVAFPAADSAAPAIAALSAADCCKRRWYRKYPKSTARPAAPSSTTSPKVAATRAWPDSLCCLFTTGFSLMRGTNPTMGLEGCVPEENRYNSLGFFHRRSRQAKPPRGIAARYIGDISKTEATGNSPVEIPQLLRSNLATWNIDCTYTGSGV